MASQSSQGKHLWLTTHTHTQRHGQDALTDLLQLSCPLYCYRKSCTDLNAFSAQCFHSPTLGSGRFSGEAEQFGFQLRGEEEWTERTSEASAPAMRHRFSPTARIRRIESLKKRKLAKHKAARRLFHGQGQLEGLLLTSLHDLLPQLPLVLHALLALSQTSPNRQPGSRRKHRNTPKTLLSIPKLQL